MWRRFMWVLVMGMAVGVQGAPGGGGFGGGGGGGGFGGDAAGGGGIGLIQINIDPDVLDSIQQTATVWQQVFTNMQNAGEDPQQFMADMVRQVQDGTFDQDMVQQRMAAKGYLTQEMLTQLQTAQMKMQIGVQRMEVNATYDTIKQLLKPTEEEWNILLPKVQRVMDLKAEVAQGGDTMNQGNTVLGVGGGLGGGGRGGGGVQDQLMSSLAGPQGSDSELGKAWKAVQRALENKQMAAVQLKGKLDAWRMLHEKARMDLRTAQADLVSILTLRQEAVMLIAGVL